MRNGHNWQLVLRGAAFGLVAGLLLGSGPAAIAAEEEETAAAGATAMGSSNRPDCDDSSVVAAQFLEKSSAGLQPKTVKCKGANRIDPPVKTGTYDGVCNNQSKCSAAHPGDKIEVETELSKSALGISGEPVVEVISVVIVQTGTSTCYTYCTGTGGSKSCEKICD